MKLVIELLVAALMLCYTAAAQTSSHIVCDENCKTESGAAVVKGDGFAVVSPVGRGTVQMIEMAPVSHRSRAKPLLSLAAALWPV